MFGPQVSRWTTLHFGVGLTAFVLAELLMVSGAAFPAMPLAAPGTFAAVHLLTIGWLTVLMLGALHQFVPVIAARSQTSQWPALVSLIIIVAGLVGMEVGFVSLDGVLPRAAIIALPVGGVLVLAAVILAAVSITQIMLRSRPIAFSSRFIMSGLAFVFLTIGLGITFAYALAVPESVPWVAMFTEGVRLHLMAGMIGWFTLTAMGVSYRLLSMFTLAPEDRGVLGNVVLGLSVGGLAATWLLGVAESAGAAVPDALTAVAEIALALGVVLYLVDMALMFRARRRRALELNASMSIAAFGALGLCVALAVYATVTGRMLALAGPLGYLFVFGWLSGLALSQLYKIVPFLTWLERYGPLLGKQAVPRVQDLVNERRDQPWFFLYFVAVAAGVLCGAFGWTLGWRVAIGVQLVATLMIIWALWCVRHRAPQSVQPAPRAKAMPADPTLRTTGN